MDSGFIISLAHFCETHGPTSILCTQLASVSCHTCNPLNTPPSEHISKTSSFSSGFFDPASLAKISAVNPSSRLAAPFTSPPSSPRNSKAPSSYFPTISHQDEQARARQGRRGSEQSDGSCENCTYLVPQTVSEQLPVGAPGSPAKDGKARNGSPVFRSQQAVIAYGQATPPRERSSPTSSQPSPENSYTERGGMMHKESRRHREQPSALSPSTASNFSMRSRGGNTHTHTLTYVTTRQPVNQDAYSLLRRAVLRTFACESLPRGSSAGSMTFGDSASGYTVAYLFRLPDPRARGSWRKYALLCLGPKDGWKTTSVFVQLTKMFEQIAAYIVGLADRVLAREASGMVTPITAGINPSMATTIPNVARSSSPSAGDVVPTAATGISTKPPLLSDVSSFLRAKRVDADGYPLHIREAMQARSLAEIVGRDEIFVELHAKFCTILGGLTGGYRPVS